MDRRLIPYERGTMFEMTPDRTLSTLASFDFVNTGGMPEAPLVQGSDGNLYGTTFAGSNASGTNRFGRGTIFRLVLPSASTPPVLSIAQSGRQVVLSWATNAAGFTLQSSPELGPSANWSNSIDSPVIVADQCFVTNATSTSSKFYRLKK